MKITEINDTHLASCLHHLLASISTSLGDEIEAVIFDCDGVLSRY